jgi:hypothetical protein
MIKKLFVLIASVLFTISAFAQTPVIGPVGLSGVLSINSSTGNFTFTGSGVSCTGTTCTFTGGSGSFTALSGDAHSTLTGGATTVTGLNGVRNSRRLPPAFSTIPLRPAFLRLRPRLKYSRGSARRPRILSSLVRLQARQRHRLSARWLWLTCPQASRTPILRQLR